MFNSNCASVPLVANIDGNGNNGGSRSYLAGAMASAVGEMEETVEQHLIPQAQSHRQTYSADLIRSPSSENLTVLQTDFVMDSMQYKAA